MRDSSCGLMPIAISGPNIGVAINCLTMAKNTIPVSRVYRPAILMAGNGLVEMEAAG
jgi:hypothetical protein